MIENLAGEICKILFPIHEEVFYGNSKSSLALCTLSSIKLLKEISNSTLMSKIAIAGRLLSENNGIDLLVRYVLSNRNINKIILCGKDASGHKPGHSLVKLHENGIDYEGRIIGSSSPHPILTLEKSEILDFQKQVKIVNKIGETNMSKIKILVDSIIQV